MEKGLGSRRVPGPFSFKGEILGVLTFNENGVFLPISYRSALLFLRDTLHRGAKAPGSAQNPSKTRSFMPDVKTLWQFRLFDIEGAESSRQRG
jgi:hypothetical protein